MTNIPLTLSIDLRRPYVLSGNAAEDYVVRLLQRDDAWVIDADGNRLVLCRSCHRPVKIADCWTYGGEDSLNSGECNHCESKRYVLRSDLTVGDFFAEGVLPF